MCGERSPKTKRIAPFQSPGSPPRPVQTGARVDVVQGRRLPSTQTMPSRRPPSRAQLAFDSLLAPDDDDPPSAPRPTRRAPSPPRRDARLPRHAFTLREDASAATAVGAAAADPLTTLVRRFPTADADLLADTLAGCGGTLAAALEVLAALGITEGPPPPIRTPAAPVDAARPTPSVWDGLWGGLPPDVQAVIWEALPSRDAARAAPTCREFAQRAAAGRAAVRTLRAPRGAAPSVVAAMVASHPRATGLDLAKWDRLDGEDADDVLLAVMAAAETGEARRARRLQALTLPPGDGLSDGAIAAAIARLTGLHRITIAGCDAAGDGTARSLLRYRRAEPAWVSDNKDDADASARPLDPHSTLPSTTTAGLVAAGVARAAGSAVPRRVTPRRPPAGGLTSVALRGARALTGVGAASLLRERGLESVDVSHCPRVTDACLRAPLGASLAAVDARGCRGLRRVALLDATAAPSLTTLTLAACPGLEAVTLNLPSLITLSVSGCRSLVELEVSAPSLTALAASGCPSLTTLWPAGACPALADVNLFGARSLPSAALEPALAGAATLTRLVVNGGTSLSRLRVPSHSLAALDAAGCGALAEVATSSSGLTELRLDGCGALARLEVIGAPRLRLLRLDGTDRLPAGVRAAVARLVRRGRGA